MCDGCLNTIDVETVEGYLDESFDDDSQEDDE